MGLDIILTQQINIQVEKLVKLPKSIKDLRIKHFDALTDERVEIENPTLLDKCYFISKFTGSDLFTIKSFSMREVEKMFEHILLVFEGFKPKAMPPKEITLNGNVYELVNPEKVATSWHIDMTNKDIQKDAVELACMFYFPKGSIYGAVDVNKNFLNPLKDRYTDFQMHMELTTFMEANAFFLSNWSRSTRISMEKRNSKLKVEKRLKRMIGQR